MKLSFYLAETGLTYEKFAELLGSSPFTVGKWARGQRMPRPAQMKAIAAATQGKVTANDFIAQEAPAA